MPVVSTSYFASISHFALLAKFKEQEIETKEHFVKQTLRNRCYIYNSNGLLNLSIPLVKWKNHTPIEDIKISYDEDWQKIHWRSIESAYRNSPFFEFYADEISDFFKPNKISNLIEFNQSIERLILELLGMKVETNFTTQYEKQNPDWRNILNLKENKSSNYFDFPSYIQPFGDKHGFIPNLSILDLLFNLGPESRTYLNTVKLL